MSEERTAVDRPKFGIGSIVKHPKYGLGRVVGYDTPFYVIHFKGDMHKVPFSYSELSAESLSEDPSISALKQALGEMLGDYGWLDCSMDLGARWAGGSIRLIPGNPNTQEKEIPLESFFKKIISVREKLRVLEQKINNHPSLSQEEKLDLEGYISRTYGSLTSFNILFSNKPAHFKGSGKA